MLAVSLAMGIAVAYFMLMNNIILAILFLLGFTVFIVLYIISDLNRTVALKRLLFGLTFLGCFILGGLLFNHQVVSYEKADLGNHYHDITAGVQKVELTDAGLRLELYDISVSGIGKLGYKMELRVLGSSSVDIGDKVSFYAKLTDKYIIYEDRFLAGDVSDLIKYTSTVYAENLSILESNLTVFQKVNLFIRDSLKSGLRGQEFSVAYALLTGGSEQIPDDVISVFRDTGVAHIFAVSGLHIGFLAVVLNFLFRKIPINAYLKTVIISAILFFYSGVCGFSASSLRACIMSSIMLLSSIRGERYDGLTSVSIAGFIILLFSPVQLLCVGFQLSFVVVIGILIFSPTLTRLLKFLPRKLASSLSTVISAQISGIPILLYAFNQFSVISIVVNLLFIPVVGVIYIALITCTLIGGIFSVSNYILFLLEYALRLITWLIAFFDRELFIVGGFTFGVFALLYYGVIIVASGMLNFKRITSSVVCVVLATCCVLGVTLKSTKPESIRAYVSGSETFSFTLMSGNTENTLIVSDVEYIFSIGRLKRLKDKENIGDLDNVIILKSTNDVDLQVFTTKVRTVFPFDNLYYYGERDNEMEEVLKYSFPELLVRNYEDGDILDCEEFSYAVKLNGDCITYSANGKRVAVFSKFEADFISYYGLGENPEVIICHNYAENINALYQPDKLIVYRPVSEFVNAESRGNIKFYF